MPDYISPWRRRVVSAALGELGTAEDPPGSQSGPVAKYQRLPDGSQRAVAWCAYFAVWCYLQADPPVHICRSMRDWWMVGDVDELWAMVARAGRLRGTKEQPEIGDLCFLKNRGGSDKGDGGHVGVVVKVEPERVLCVSGNWGDKVAQHYVRLDAPNLRGFGWQ